MFFINTIRNLEVMDKRSFLRRVLEGGEVRLSRMRVYNTIKGVKTLVSEKDIDSDIDITINVVANDPKQLELQKGKG